MNSGKELRIALFDFEARNELELSFQRGDVISVISSDPSGWWKGSLNSKIGNFPEPYTTSTKELLVLFDIPPFQEVSHTLVIPKNQVIHLRNKENKDWWRVFWQKKEGFIPSSYVKEKGEENWPAVAMYNFTQMDEVSKSVFIFSF